MKHLFIEGNMVDVTVSISGAHSSDSFLYPIKKKEGPQSTVEDFSRLEMQQQKR